jgi:hypothetical protein
MGGPISRRIGKKRRPVTSISAAPHCRRFLRSATNDRPVADSHVAGDRSGAAGKGRPIAIQR